MTVRTLGIDLGHSGALALLVDGELVEVADMPTLPDGPRSRPAVCTPLLAYRLREWRPVRAYVELVNARPTDGPVGAFAFGRARGAVEGCLGAMTVPLAWLSVPAWRKAVGLPVSIPKDHARAEAIRRWPAFADRFARVMDDGRAEACLIALAGLLQERRS
jgi:crossover junction endodeoxyribonuclease RuvC